MAYMIIFCDVVVVAWNVFETKYKYQHTTLISASPSSMTPPFRLAVRHTN